MVSENFYIELKILLSKITFLLINIIFISTFILINKIKKNNNTKCINSIQKACFEYWSKFVTIFVQITLYTLKLYNKDKTSWP